MNKKTLQRMYTKKYNYKEQHIKNISYDKEIKKKKETLKDKIKNFGKV